MKIKQFTISKKIALLSGIPLIAYLIVSVFFMVKDFNESRVVLLMEQNINRLSIISDLILELQRERGKTNTYLNGGMDFDEIEAQKNKTNIQIKLVQSELIEKSETGKKEDLAKLLDEITVIRNTFNQKEKSPLEVFKSYSGLISKYLKFYRHIANESTTRGIGKEIVTLNILEEAKEFYAQFRGLTSGLLARNTAFNTEEFSLVNKYKTGAERNLESGALILSNSSELKLKNLFDSAAWKNNEADFKTILEKYSKGNFGIESTVFFESASKVVDGIQELLTAEKKDIVKQVAFIADEITTGLWINFGAFVFTTFLIIYLTLLIIRSITRPVKTTTSILMEMAQGEGDLTRTIEVKSKDEIRDLAEYFNKFIGKLKTMVETLKKQSENLSGASSELAANSEQTAASVQEITASSNAVLQNVNREKEMIQKSTQEIIQILTEMGNIDRMTDEMKDQITQSSSAIEEMAANIASVADMASKTKASSESLLSSSDKGNSAIHSLSQSIEDVSKDSDKIVEMVQLILDIAEQTNLLAMNAAIEAAHAGEYGKGFAVVAEEIRKLADKSGKSAKEIQAVVHNISESIHNNQKLSAMTKESFDYFKKEVLKVNQANNEIAVSMEEQKIANQAVLKSTNQLNTLSVKIVGDLKNQVGKGQNIKNALAALNTTSEEIAIAMGEQKSGLDEAASSAEHISNIALKLKEVADKIEADFNKFKTA